MHFTLKGAEDKTFSEVKKLWCCVDRQHTQFTITVKTQKCCISFTTKK